MVEKKSNPWLIVVLVAVIGLPVLVLVALVGLGVIAGVATQRQYEAAREQSARMEEERARQEAEIRELVSPSARPAPAPADDPLDGL
ncbi:MAG: hypothetical protein KF729_36885 [Sandaracinaceae bacterium]|nr:hypothetical protein [Sandaracinaceae bacterium]